MRIESQENNYSKGENETLSLSIVTGANRGIGLELARQLTGRGTTVLATCRRASDELRHVGCEIFEGLDVTSDDALGKLAASIKNETVHLLINNAGILTRETLEDLDWARMRREFEVNALGPLRTTKALLANLRSGSKVAIVSSRVGSLADNSSGGNYGYRMSKAAVNMAGVNLAHDLRSREIPVVLLHPGYVRTDLTGGHGNTDTTTSARGLLERIDETTMERSGTFWHAEGYELPW